MGQKRFRFSDFLSGWGFPFHVLSIRRFLPWFPFCLCRFFALYPQPTGQEVFIGGKLSHKGPKRGVKDDREATCPCHELANVEETFESSLRPCHAGPCGSSFCSVVVCHGEKEGKKLPLKLKAFTPFLIFYLLSDALNGG